MKLIPATMDDARFLHELRNDPLTRANSRTSTEVQWEHHLTWLAAVLIDPQRRLYIAHHGGAPVGTGRLDYADAHVELSLTVAPEWRGKGHARWIITELVAHVVDDRRMVAETWNENAPCLIALLKTSFRVQATRRESDRTWVWLTREK